LGDGVSALSVFHDRRRAPADPPHWTQSAHDARCHIQRQLLDDDASDDTGDGVVLHRIGSFRNRGAGGTAIATLHNCPWLEGRSARGAVEMMWWRGAVERWWRKARCVWWNRKEVVGPAMRGAGG